MKRLGEGKKSKRAVERAKEKSRKQLAGGRVGRREEVKPRKAVVKAGPGQRREGGR